MSCASSRAPSGSIQNPNTGRKPKIPKMISSNPTETRTQRDDDPLSQRRKRPTPLGSSRDLPIEPFGVTVAHGRFVS